MRLQKEIGEWLTGMNDDAARIGLISYANPVCL